MIEACYIHLKYPKVPIILETQDDIMTGSKWFIKSPVAHIIYIIYYIFKNSFLSYSWTYLH